VTKSVQSAAKDGGSRFKVEPVLRAREQVEQQLRQAIHDGVFGLGDRLPSETDLTEHFSVSRTTVREALRTLVEEGLITRSPGARGGSFVEQVDHHALSELMLRPLNSTLKLGSISYDEVASVRDLLEVPIAELAALNRTDRHLEILHEVIDQEKATTSDDPEVPNLNARFHITLGEASGNRLLAAIVQTLHRTARPLSYIDTSQDVGRNSVRHHIAILKAVEAGNVTAARDAMRNHLRYLDEHRATIAADETSPQRGGAYTRSR
jgi:GntR family transcriptional regulator, transcriptional repressor for pyruvate dehydrogenase complex